MKDALIKNIKKLSRSANLIYGTKDYTSATILYFKLIFSVFDLIILKSKGKTPKDHNERFRTLQKNFPDLYKFLDKYFDVYRDTYTLTIDKETCGKIKDGIKKIMEKYEIS